MDLATGASRALPAGGPWSGIGQVIWAPDESAIVLSIEDTDPGADLSRNGTWIVPLDGSPARQISGDEFQPVTWQPVWPQ
jgi:hypothetical protein